MNRLFFKRLRPDEHGITGLETAIILIAFVVVASVFAYTVLSSGLFSTQKAQEAVYGGLEEAQSTLELKGVVIANGVAELNDCEYPVGWVDSVNTTMTRETSDKMEGSASLKAVIGSDALLNESLVYHAMAATDLTNGDTISFFIKGDGLVSGNITFYLSTSADLPATATESYVITMSSTNWENHTFDLTSGDDDSSIYYGIGLSTDTTGTFYLDNIRFNDVSSMNSEEVLLDYCDYPNGFTAATNAAVTRSTDEKMEGLASANASIAIANSADDAILSHAMKTKDWTDGDTITFWLKAVATLDDDLAFRISTNADLSSPTETYTINTNASTDWQKYSVTLSGGNDDSASYYGIVLLNDDGVDQTFYLDGIETEANLSDNNDPMLSYAKELVFTVGNALGGDAIDFTTTIDTDDDGILSDETTKSHKVIVSFSDAYTQVTDLAWTMTSVGKDDNDSLLESSEKFLITVDLSYVNNNVGILDQKQKIASNHQFQIEVKPHKGAVLTIERTLPIRVRDVMNLD